MHIIIINILCKYEVVIFNGSAKILRSMKFQKKPFKVCLLKNNYSDTLPDRKKVKIITLRMQKKL